MAATTTVTFIRHGESEDNLKYVWAGWQDSPLSEFGIKQAQALGRSLSSTRITHYYASPLLRAHTTAQLVHHYQPHPKPHLRLNNNLREQYFGIAEGHPWTMETFQGLARADLYDKKIFPALYERNEKFPDGESLNDLALRAEVAIRECVLPHIPSLDPESDEQESEMVHVALTSHGNCISELVGAMLRLDPEANRDANHIGLMNTAWTRLEVRLRDAHMGPIDPASPPALQVRVTHVNQREHLETLKSDPEFHVELDGVSEKAKAFFGGTALVAPEKGQDNNTDEKSKAVL